MKKQQEYLARMRQAMREHGIDACVVSGTDPHQSELPAMHWRGREWLTGFESANGTNGTAVVLQDDALCWTDSRYFLQATEQLKDTGFRMMEEDGPNAVDLVDWLVEHTHSGQTVGIDGMTFSISYAQRLEQEFGDNGVKLNTEFPVFDYIYPDRPTRPMNPLFVHDENIVGVTTDTKMKAIMEEVKPELANAILLSSLDDIAWATNLRAANDIAYSPVFVAFLYIDNERRVLFIDREKLTDEVKAHLQKYHIEVQPYDSVTGFVAGLPKETRLLLDPEKTARGIYDHVGCSVVFGGSAVAKLKSIKNECMIRSIRTAMLKDGVALTRFFMLVEREYPKGELTEIGLARELRSLRLADPTCVDESFASIIGWNGHGAIVHYEPTEESSSDIKGDGLLLVDSGGQYTFGTTDITRTIALGPLTDEQRHVYTLVLRGHIALSRAIFPDKTAGTQLDALARQFMWRDGMNYLHGTGHGVGQFLCVHEGPHQIRMEWKPTPFVEGMLVTDEPGLYLAGRFGVRIENILLTVAAKETEFGRFLQFEPLTLCPIDTTPIVREEMSPEEIAWLNDYHQHVYETLSPHLNADEQAWLREATKAF